MTVKNEGKAKVTRLSPSQLAAFKAYEEHLAKMGDEDEREITYEAMVDAKRKEEEDKETRDGLIGVGHIEEIIETIIFSGWLKDRGALSLLLVSNPGSGKTQILSQYADGKNVRMIDTLTHTGMEGKPKEGKSLAELVVDRTLKHVIVTEFSRLFSNRSTQHTVVAYVNTMVEEGSGGMMTYYVRTEHERRACGLLAAIPTGIWERYEKFYTKSGLVGPSGRLFTLCYRYTPDFLKVMKESLQGEWDFLPSNKEKKRMTLPDKVTLIILPQEVGRKMINFLMEHDVRAIHRYATLVKALALKRVTRHGGPKTVTDHDWEYVKKNFYPLLEAESHKPYLVFVPGRCYQCGKKVPRRDLATLCSRCAKKEAKRAYLGGLKCKCGEKKVSGAMKCKPCALKASKAKSPKGKAPRKDGKGEPAYSTGRRLKE